MGKGHRKGWKKDQNKKFGNSATPVTSRLPDISPSQPETSADRRPIQRILDFVEHPLFLVVVSILGGLVGVIVFTPVLLVCGFGILLALHRSNALRGLRPVQQWSISAATAIVTTVLLSWVGISIRAQARNYVDQIAQKIVEKIKSGATDSGRRAENVAPEPEKPCTPKDPKEFYIPPKGPLVRFDGGVFPPSQFMCVGLSDEARAACLCPRPLVFTVDPMPAPKDDNYENLLTISEKCEPMYRVRVFLRDIFSNTNILETYPFDKGKTGAATLHEDADRYSFELDTSAPESRYKVAIKSSRGLRVICVNQIN